MKYLESYGGVWKLSEAAYRRFLRNVAAGKAWDLNDYGKFIIPNKLNVTDITAEDAKELLSQAGKKGAQQASTTLTRAHCPDCAALVNENEDDCTCRATGENHA